MATESKWTEDGRRVNVDLDTEDLRLLRNCLAAVESLEVRYMLTAELADDPDSRNVVHALVDLFDKVLKAPPSAVVEGVQLKNPRSH